MLACVGLAFADGWVIWRSRAVELAHAQTETQNLARSLARQADDTVSSANSILIDVIERLHTDGTGSAAMERLNRHLMSELPTAPGLLGLFVYGPDGGWLASALPMTPAGLSNAAREYFPHHRDHPDLDLRIGLPVISKSSKEWIIPVSRRFNLPDGSFGGVVLATLAESYFQNYYSTLEIGGGGLARPVPPAQNAADQVMILRVVDFQATLARLKAAGQPFPFKIYNEATGGFSYIADAEGNLVGLADRRPPAAYRDKQPVLPEDLEAQRRWVEATSGGG